MNNEMYNCCSLFGEQICWNEKDMSVSSRVPHHGTRVPYYNTYNVSDNG